MCESMFNIWRNCQAVYYLRSHQRCTRAFFLCRSDLSITSKPTWSSSRLTLVSSEACLENRTFNMENRRKRKGPAGGHAGPGASAPAQHPLTAHGPQHPLTAHGPLGTATRTALVPAWHGWELKPAEGEGRGHGHLLS